MSDEAEIEIYTDGSKNSKSTGYGWFIAKKGIVTKEVSTPLDHLASVFMAEMSAIIEALHYIKSITIESKEIDLWTDSRSSIDAIAAPIIDQPLALEAHDLLLEINKNVQLNIRWVRGHSDNPGNEFADLLARKGRDTPYTGPLPALYAPRGEVKEKIKNYCRRVWEREWGRQTKYLHSRQVLPRPNLKEIIIQGSISRSDQLRLNKTQLRNLIEAITGHCLLNKHLSHWKEIKSTKCRLCEEDDETYLHLINECPAMEYERRQIFEPPYNNADKYFRDILSFLETKRVQNLRRSDLDE